MSTTPKERPILFSGPMVRAILDGRKTQTRRVMKPTLHAFQDGRPVVYCGVPGSGTTKEVVCPYGRVGDRLWVQESYGLTYIGESTPACEAGTGCRCTCFYSADGASRVVSLTAGDVRKLENRKSDRLRLQPGRFMYRSCSRLTLEITVVRVERLNEISEADAMAEGVDAVYMADVPRNGCFSRRAYFSQLWESINGPASWIANPWVWVLTFRKIEA